jgi:hypothetical protein
MKRILVALTLVMLSAPCGRVQEHAPLAAQCQSDKAVWINELDPTQISTVAVAEVNKRMWEMGSCQEVDPSNSAGYVKVATIYLMAIDARYQNFMKRHNLMSQFVQEDTEGKR